MGLAVLNSLKSYPLSHDVRRSRKHGYLDMAVESAFSIEVSETERAGMLDWRGGPLGSSPLGLAASLSVTATASEFSYRAGDARSAFAISGTGANLVYDDNNVPISGTIFSLANKSQHFGSGAGGPPNSNEITLTNLNASVQEVLGEGSLNQFWRVMKLQFYHALQLGLLILA